MDQDEHMKISADGDDKLPASECELLYRLRCWDITGTLQFVEPKRILSFRRPAGQLRASISFVLGSAAALSNQQLMPVLLNQLHMIRGFGIGKLSKSHHGPLVLIVVAPQNVCP